MIPSHHAYASHKQGILVTIRNFSSRIRPFAKPLQALVFLAVFSPVVRATDYSSILTSNPYYYVPSNLTLAYRTTVSNVPVPVGDQTLWDISSATYTNNNGTNETIFTGTAIAYVGSTNGSTSSISGTISSSGQVRMNFVANGNTNVGVGQMASFNGATNFLMQTMDGSPISYDTHWAYMSPTNTLTNLIAASSTTVPTYSNATMWTQYLSLLGSGWSYSSTSLGGTGSFTVSSYTNGYFSGSGVSSGSTNFYFLNSVTPDGAVLFNDSVPGNPYVGSLWGQFSGSNVGASISLATYDSSGNSNYDGAGTMTTVGLVIGFATNGQTATFSNGFATNFGSTFVGYTTNGNANGLTITSNSVVSNSYDVTIGYEGSSNSLTITNGGKLYDRDGYVTAVAGSNNFVIINGEGSVWSNSRSLYVAASPDHSGTGTVTLLSGGTLAASNLIISGVTNSVGTVEVGLKGGTDSNMTLNVQMISFGDGTGSLGLNQSDTLTISGSIVGATATNSYAMIQQYGSGTTVLTGISHTGTGYRVDGGQLRVDVGIFDIVLSAGASPDELGGPRTVCVGNKHSGNSLVITNGGYVHSFVTIIGTGTQKDTDALTGTSNNWALVTGRGSQLDAGELLIGNVSSGNRLLISNGAIVGCSLFTSIGESGSSNRVIIDGTGSLFSNAGSLNLGSYSESNVSVENSILITNGGGLFSGSATIASSTNSYGNSVTVTGSGSFWTNSGELILGDSGSSNSIVISNGGSVTCYAGYVGAYDSSTGNSVLIIGRGSTFTVVSNNAISPSGILFIGAQPGNGVAGSGTVTVANGAVLTASQIQIGQFGDLDFGRYQQSDSAGSAVGDIVFTATNDENYGINFNQTNTFTFSNNVSGPGWICALGTGTTVMNGSNNYSQYTKIDAGTIIAASTNALGTGYLQIGGTANQAMITLATNLTVGDFIWQSNGVVALSVGSQTLTVAAMTNLVGANGGNVFEIINPSINNRTNTLINFTSQTNFTPSSFSVNGIAGYSFAVTSNSIQSYIATNANVVLSIPVVVTNSFHAGSVTVLGPSGCISGNGSINALVTNGGTIAPGNGTPGTLTVNGNYVQTSDGTLQIQVANGGNSFLTVNGTATLGGTLALTPVGGHQFQYGEKIVFLSAASITGSFSSVDVPDGFRGRVKVFGDPMLEVIIAPVSYTQMAQNRNQSNVASALNSFIPATSGDRLVVSTTLDSLTAGQYNQAFNAIMPSFYQQIATIAFNQANAQNMELSQRLWGLRIAEGGGFSMSGLADNYAMLQEGQGDGGKGVLDSKKDILRPGLDNRWGMFVDGNGIFAQANSANMLPGYNSESGGVTAGLTYKWNKNVASGIYCGYQGTYTKSGANGSGLGTGSSLTDNAVRFGVFGTYGQENGKGFYANALAGGAYHNLQATRVIQFPGLNRTASSAPGAGELDTMLATGYDVQKGNFTFGPTASLQYTYLGVNGVNETGAQSLNFNSSGWNSSSMLSSLGAHAAYTWYAHKNIVVVPQISLNWQHEFMQNPYSISGNLGGVSPTFSNWSASPIRDYLYTGVGFTVEFAKRWNTSFFYNAVAGNQNLTSQNIFWSAGLKF
jgi:T5SS/PEP-CTERM-associated repeat protein